MRISDWSSDVCSSDLTTSWRVSGRFQPPQPRFEARGTVTQLVNRIRPLGDVAATRQVPGFFAQILGRVERQRIGAAPAPAKQGLQTLIEPMRRGITDEARRELLGIEADLCEQAVEAAQQRSEEHTSELQSLMRSSY